VPRRYSPCDDPAGGSGGYPPPGAAGISSTAGSNPQLPIWALARLTHHRQASKHIKKSTSEHASPPAVQLSSIRDPHCASMSRLCPAVLGHLQTAFFSQTIAIFYYYFLTFSNIFHFFACITLSVLLQISTDSESRVTNDGHIGLPVAVRSKLLHHWLFVALAHKA